MLSDEEKALVTSALESALTLYCKSRSISYDRDAGWTHILHILVALRYSKAELYNCFYAITTRYIPRFVAGISCSLFVDVVLNARSVIAQWDAVAYVALYLQSKLGLSFLTIHFFFVSYYPHSPSLFFISLSFTIFSISSRSFSFVLLFRFCW